MGNVLEALVAEWYGYQGYFVRRNVLVGRRPRGGYESELDVVAFHPGKGHLVHVEPSMDADSWAERERRYAAKFAAGRAHIPGLFAGLALPAAIEQIALLGYGSTGRRRELAGGRIMLVGELLEEIGQDLRRKPVAKAAVPETYPILKALQFASHAWTTGAA